MVAAASVALLLVTFDIFFALRRPSLLVVRLLLLRLLIIITIHQIDDADDVGDALRPSGNSGNGGDDDVPSRRDDARLLWNRDGQYATVSSWRTIQTFDSSLVDRIYRERSSFDGRDRTTMIMIRLYSYYACCERRDA